VAGSSSRSDSIVIALAVAMFMVLASLPMGIFPTVSATNDPTQPGTGGTAYVSGNWTVMNSKEYHDCILVVSGNLTVISGGSLTLNNVTLKMNSTFDGQYSIMVKPGGAFRAYNGTLISAKDTTHPYKFVVNATGVLEFINVTVSHCGMDGALPYSWEGLYIESDNVKIDRSNLSNNEYGIIVYGANITLTNSTLNDNIYHGALFAYSMTSRIEHVNVSHNGFYGLALMLSKAKSVKDVVAINNSYDGVAFYKSNLTINKVRSNSNQRLGVISQSGNVTMIDSEFVNNAFFDVYETGHNMTGMTGPGNVDLFDVVFGTYHLHDPTVSLNVSYSTNISVKWRNGGPVSGANVTIYNNSITANGELTFKGTTDSNGKLSGVMLKSLEESSFGRWALTPHSFVATKDGKIGQTDFNVTRPWSQANVTIDPNPPELNITSPVEGALINMSSVRVSGTASDYDGIDRAEVWNGTNWTVATGNASWMCDLTLLDGQHAIKVRAFDKFGSRTEALVNFTTDTLAPEIVIQSPLSGYLTNSTSVLVTGRTEPGATVSFGAHSVINQAGNFSFVANLTAEGPNIIQVVATDAAQNTNWTSISVLRDTQVPEINLTWPPPNFGTQDDYITLSGHVLYASNMSFGNGLLYHEINVYNNIFEHIMPVFEGRNDIAIRAWDEAGNSASVILTVIKDTTAPMLSVVWPSTDPVNEHHLPITIITEPGANVTVNGLPVTNTNGTIIYIMELYQGLNTFTVSSKDWLGNINSTWRSIQADFMIPVLVVDKPSEGEVLKSRMVNLFGIATDDTGIVKVEAKVDGLQWFDCQGTDSWLKVLELEPGAHTIIVRAWDLVGNNATAMVNFSVLIGPTDLHDPIITIGWPKSGMNLTEGQITFFGTSSDDVSVRSVEWSTDGSNWHPCNGTLYWNMTVQLGKGYYLYYFRVTDTTGKTNVSSISFNVKTKGTIGHGKGANPYILWFVIVLVLAIISVAIYAIFMARRDKKAIEEEARIERKGAASYDDEDDIEDEEKIGSEE
jgi:hypothetical protein